MVWVGAFHLNPRLLNLNQISHNLYLRWWFVTIILFKFGWFLKLISVLFFKSLLIRIVCNFFQSDKIAFASEALNLVKSRLQDISFKSPDNFWSLLMISFHLKQSKKSMYRVSHIEMSQSKWFWGVEGSIFF